MPDVVINVGDNEDVPIEIVGDKVYIKGDKGDQGYPGPQGEQGPQGETGPQGEQGPQGNDGFSPIVRTIPYTTGVVITIQDAEGLHTADIHHGMNGRNGTDGEKGDQGEPGQDGADGVDGVSPGVSIETIAGGHSVTITDAEHPAGQSFNVLDGAPGNYTKPETGIPASDLADGVIPTVPTAYTSDDQQMDGTASAGSSTSWARGDHRHPHDSLIVRQNLLDNWYFVKGSGTTGDYGVFPVNQRGQATYSGTGYHIDRWTNYNITSMALDSDGITLVASASGFVLNQKITSPALCAGQTLTATALFSSVSGGSAGVRLAVGSAAYSPTTDLSSGGISTVSRKLTDSNDLTSIGLNIRLASGTTAKLVAVKLEIGDTQTLAHNEGTDANPVWVLNELPNYAEQLARCQRYYFRMPTDSTYIKPVGFGAAINATTLRIAIPLPQVMYKTPTVTSSSGLTMNGYHGTNAKSFANPSFSNTYLHGSICSTQITDSGLTANEPYIITIHGSNAFLEFTADIT